MIIESKAYGVLIWNITHTEKTKPVSEIYHRDLKVGRYEGLEPKWCKKEINDKEP